MQKYFRNNRDIFLRYFDGYEQYEALIRAGNFRKMAEIIDENSTFDLVDFVKSLEDKDAE